MGRPPRATGELVNEPNQPRRLTLLPQPERGVDLPAA